MSSYHTVQKDKLTAFLREHHDAAFTVEEIAAEMHGDHAPGKSTVYRLMTQLVEAGEVKRFVKGNSRQFVYQAVCCEHPDPHLHMKCTGCGKLLHLDDRTSHALLHDVLKNTNFAVDERQTVLFGTCSDCGKDGKCS